MNRPEHLVRWSSFFLVITGVTHQSWAQRTPILGGKPVELVSRSVIPNPNPTHAVLATSLSGDGRYLVFESQAKNFFPLDTASFTDVYLFDRLTLQTRQLSRSASGQFGNNHSTAGRISTDGNWVVFSSRASNLVPNDYNGMEDIFKYHVPSGTLSIVTWAGSFPCNGPSNTPSISSNGRYIALTSFSTNLISGLPSTAISRVYRYDQQTNSFALASTPTGSTNNTHSAFETCISSDGSRIGFISGSSTLVPGDANGLNDIFVKNLTTGQTTLVSKSSAGVQANATSQNARLSGDGLKAYFTSDSNNLIPNDTNNRTDLFAYDLATGQLDIVNKGSSGQQSLSGVGYNNEYFPDATGNKCSFSSSGTELDPGDHTMYSDVYLRDSLANTTTLESILATGAQMQFGAFVGGMSSDARYLAISTENAFPNDQWYNVYIQDRVDRSYVKATRPAALYSTSDSSSPSLSYDGRYVCYTSNAFNLVFGDVNGVSDVFVTDRSSGLTELVSVSSSGAQGNGAAHPQFPSLDDSTGPKVSSTGRFVLFSSDASNLVSNDINGQRDVFLRDRTTAVTELVSRSVYGFSASFPSKSHSISPDGRYVLFSSASSDITTNDTNAMQDVFLLDRLSGNFELISRSHSGAPGNGHSEGVAISDDGRFVLFGSSAANLVPNDTNGKIDSFVRDRMLGTLTCVSYDQLGSHVNSDVNPIDMSADGRFVLMSSVARLAAEVTTNQNGYVLDRSTGIVAVATRKEDGSPLNSVATVDEISDDGYFVLFTDNAPDVRPNSAFIFKMPFICDWKNRRVYWGEQEYSSNHLWGDHNACTLSGRGNTIAFIHAGLFAGAVDYGGYFDVFAKDLLLQRYSSWGP